MRILITNDDSVTAQGIAVLAEAAMEFGDVYVAAPARQCSAMSQRLTLRETLTVEPVADFPVPVRQVFRIGGTPVDCVKVALDYLWPEKPELVLSGINHGYNVGFDIAYSGTLGAAFEAGRHGIPAIALSLAAKGDMTALKPLLSNVLRELIGKPREPGRVWNVNFPKPQGEVPRGILWDCPVAPIGLYREHYIENRLPDGTIELSNTGIPTENDRIPAGTDADAVRRGYIAVSALQCMY